MRRSTTGRRAPRTAAGVAVALALFTLAACESVTVSQVNQARAATSVAALTTSDALTLAARDHSSAMCASGVVAPSGDPATDYLEAEGATALTDLVGSAELDPSITDWTARNADAAAEIWATWSGDARLLDPRWQSVGVGEVDCGDGRLYSTLVLRDDPPPLGEPADTSRIAFVETTTTGGWRFDRYRNSAAPCAISGFQTFVIGTKVGSSPTATKPLWVKMRGGGAGWFDDDGTPLPTALSLIHI